MRTTLTLDRDVALKAKKGAARLGKPFKEVVNMALRAGLDIVLSPPRPKPYRTHARPLGLRKGFSYDNVSELLARIEGENHSCFSLTPTGFRVVKKFISEKVIDALPGIAANDENIFLCAGSVNQNSDCLPKSVAYFPTARNSA